MGKDTEKNKWWQDIIIWTFIIITIIGIPTLVIRDLFGDDTPSEKEIRQIVCEENGGLFYEEAGENNEGVCTMAIADSTPEPTITIPLADFVKSIENIDICKDFTCEETDLPLHEALQLLIDAGEYKYVPEKTETEPAKLITN